MEFFDVKVWNNLFKLNLSFIYFRLFTSYELFFLNLGNENVATLLIKNSAYIDSIDDYNRTPLHIALEYGLEII